MAGRKFRWGMTSATYERYMDILLAISHCDPDLDPDQLDDLKGDLARLPGFPHIGVDEDDLVIPEITDLH